MFNFERLMQNLSDKRPIFHAEADFQHALAWEIQKHYPESDVRLETKVFGKNTKIYLDILVTYQGKRYAIELKYKTRGLDCVVNGEEFYLNNQGAQDIGRYDVLKDLYRLEQMVDTGVVDEGVLIFLTNDSTYYSPPYGNQTVNQAFRIHEGRMINGELKWADNTGQGTMRGREEPISLFGSYSMRWRQYSQVETSKKGAFQYLLLNVNKSEFNSYREPEVLDNERPIEVNQFLSNNKGEITPHTNSDKNISEDWFKSFSSQKVIPTSQLDFRDKLANCLKELGYSVHKNREMGKDKVDLFATKGDERIVIEVRYKTALLKTIHQGEHVHLKNQGAQDISRYDFLSDLEKVERVVDSRPGLKGYAILLTNDHLYWKPPRKHDSVDKDFHIHNGRVVSSQCLWGREASRGTTAGRERILNFKKTYPMKWQPYLNLGNEKNMVFQALVIEVNS